MAEYHISPRQFYHDYPPPLIRSLATNLRRRKLREYRAHVVATHASEPEKLLKQIDVQLQPPDWERTVDMEYSEDQIQTFNIHITKSPE